MELNKYILRRLIEITVIFFAIIPLAYVRWFPILMV